MGVVEELKAAVKRNPWPNYYPLIVWGMDRTGSCFNRSTVNYLLSEALRLSRMKPSHHRQEADALDSLTRIYGILEENAVRCSQSEIALRLGRLKSSAQNDYDRLRDQYLGRFF